MKIKLLRNEPVIGLKRPKRNSLRSALDKLSPINQETQTGDCIQTQATNVFLLTQQLRPKRFIVRTIDYRTTRIWRRE